MSFYFLRFFIIDFSGTLIIDALKETERYVPEYYLIGIKKMIDKLEYGEDLSIAMKESKLFCKESVMLIKSAEKTGKLKSAIQNIINFLEVDIEYRLQKAINLFPPITIVLISLLIGLCLFALYIPLFSLGDVIL